MEAVLSRLKGLSAAELSEEFARAHLKCGPITCTTRATYERKLARVLAEQEGYTTETNDGFSPGISDDADHSAKPVSNATTAAATATATTSSSSSETATEDLEFGYGVGLNPPEEEEISVKATSKTAAEFSDFKAKTETPSKSAEVSPNFYYGVCPPWEDVLARSGKQSL